MAKLLSILTVLAGLVLAGTPWLFRFTSDRMALADVVVGGLVVALLGIFTTASLAVPR
jgi:hypothetical protein